MLAAVNPAELRGFSAIDPLLTSMEDDGNNNTYNDNTIKKKSAKQTLIQRAVNMLQMDPPPVSRSDSDNNLDTPTGISRSDSNFMPDDIDMSLPVRDIPGKLAQQPASRVTSTSNSTTDETTTAPSSDLLVTPNNTAVQSRSTTEYDTDNDTTPTPTSSNNEKTNNAPTQMELRCVIAIIRHGDRTPKQKMKVNMTEPHLLAYFHEHCDNPKKDLKIKAKKPMREFLELVKLMIREKEEARKLILETSKKRVHPSSLDLFNKLKIMRDVLLRWKIGGLNRKLQIKPKSWEEVEDEEGNVSYECTEAQVILKWGGNLTKLGERQAINLGQRLRHEVRDA
jgi:inositol hexakisphosphate/diphosphoinositol-pentakisphosphate kinase